MGPYVFPLSSFDGPVYTLPDVRVHGLATCPMSGLKVTETQLESPCQAFSYF